MVSIAVKQRNLLSFSPPSPPFAVILFPPQAYILRISLCREPRGGDVRIGATGASSPDGVGGNYRGK